MATFLITPNVETLIGSCSDSNLGSTLQHSFTSNTSLVLVLLHWSRVASGVKPRRCLHYRNHSLENAPPTQTIHNALFTQHIFRELISSSSTCLLSHIPKWSGQYLHMVHHIHSAMELPSTELDRTNAASQFPAKVRSGSTPQCNFPFKR